MKEKFREELCPIGSICTLEEYKDCESVRNRCPIKMVLMANSLLLPLRGAVQAKVLTLRQKTGESLIKELDYEKS